MTMCRTVGASMLALLTCGSASAEPGVVLTQRTTANGRTDTGQVQMTSQRMRAAGAIPGGGPQVIIYDGVSQTLYSLTPDRKSYTELTTEDVDRLGAQLSELIGQVKAMLQNLPQERRAQLETQLRTLGGSAATALLSGSTQMEYRRTGTERVGEWTCESYDVVLGDETVAHTCNVSPETLGLTEADLGAARQLSAFMNRMVPQLASGLMQMGTGFGNGPGISVKSSTKGIGRMPSSETELTGVQRQDLSDDLFKVPEGFQKQAFPSGLVPLGLGSPAPGPR